MRVFGRRISSRRPHRPSVLRSTRRHCPRNRAPCSPVDRHHVLEPHLILPLVSPERYVSATYVRILDAGIFFHLPCDEIQRHQAFRISDLSRTRTHARKFSETLNAHHDRRENNSERFFSGITTHSIHIYASLTSIDTQPRSTRKKQFDHGAVSTFVLRRPSRAGRLRQIR